MAPRLNDSFASVVDHLPADFLLDTAGRSLAFLCLVSLAVLGLRRASAATRHWAWLLGFVGLLILPLTVAAVPGWRVLPRLGLGSPVAAGPALLPDDRGGSPRPNIGTTFPQPAHPLDGPAAMAVATPHAAALMTVDQRLAASSVVRPVTLTSATWIAVAWLAGTTLVLVRLVLGYVGLGRLRRRCSRVDDGEWRDQLDHACRLVGVRRTVQLLADPRSPMPMTWGLCHPTVLLPAAAVTWEPARRQDVLLHELGHVRRFDCVTQLLAQVACAAYWFNPLVWLAWRGLQAERERACDDIVLGTGTAAAAYAQHLVDCAAALPGPWFTLPALAMARPSTLELRLRTILDPGRNRATLGRPAGWASLVLLLAILTPVAVLHAQEAAKRDGPPATTQATTRPDGRVARGRAGDNGPAVMGKGPTCAFGATIYELRVPADKIGLLDAAALDAAAATPAGFEKALADLGTSRPLYHTDQTVRLASDSIMIGENVPVVTNSQVTAAGRVIRSTRYQSVGAAFTLAGKSDGPDKIECDLKIELSTISVGQPKAEEGAAEASKFRTATLSHNGPAHPKRPFVILSADAANTDDSGKAVVYVARVTFGTPE